MKELINLILNSPYFWVIAIIFIALILIVLLLAFAGVDGKYQNVRGTIVIFPFIMSAVHFIFGNPFKDNAFMAYTIFFIFFICLAYSTDKENEKRIKKLEKQREEEENNYRY